MNEVDRPLPTGWGYKPDIPDIRDYSARQILRMRVADLRPRAVDLRDQMPRVLDQGTIGSCVSQSVAAMVWFARRKFEGGDITLPSRPFIYYESRKREGTLPIDAGQYIRTALKVISHEGAAPSYMWEHELDENDLPMLGSSMWPETSRWARPPTERVYEEAKRWQAIEYFRIQGLDQMLDCLADGWPFVVGFGVYRSFYDDEGYPRVHVPMPSTGEIMYGGHAVVVVGYNMASSEFLCRNSWGPNVQDQGNFWLPFDYLNHPYLASDFWTIREVEGHGRRD